MGESPNPKPLQSHVFHILMSLLDRQRHGYSIIKDISQRTNGEVELGTSTVYAAIKRMMRDGLLEETDKPADEDSADVRRRYYRATDLGREVAREEALRVRRLSRMVAEAKVLDGETAR